MNYKYFTVKELECKCGKCGGGDHMNPSFMLKLEYLREACGFPFVLSSAYRCADHNKAVSDTGYSGPHVQGQAVDILVSGERAYRLIMYAIKYGFTGIGISQKGPHESRYVHLDDLTGDTRPWIWSY